MGLLKRAQEKAGRAKFSGQGKRTRGKAKAAPAAGKAIAVQDPGGIRPQPADAIAQARAADQAKAIALPPASTPEEIVRPAVVGKVETKPAGPKDGFKKQEATWITILEVLAAVVVLGTVFALPVIAQKLKPPDD